MIQQDAAISAAPADARHRPWPRTESAVHSGTGASRHRTIGSWLGRPLGRLCLLCPEMLLGLMLFDAARQATRNRFPAQDRDRGDAIQWVIVTAIGAAIAVTVGTIIFNKLRAKANGIDVTTPGAR